MWDINQRAGDNVDIAKAVPSSGTGTNQITVKFADNVDFTIIRGTTDTDITAIAMRNASGQKVFVYPNASADGVTVSTTAP